MAPPAATFFFGGGHGGQEVKLEKLHYLLGIESCIFRDAFDGFWRVETPIIVAKFLPGLFFLKAYNF